jgi:hypothetical protein
MGDKGERIIFYSDLPGVFSPPAIAVRWMVGEWSELRTKVGFGQKVIACPVWRLRLET